MNSEPKPRILAVDDNPDNLALLHVLLKRSYSIQLADSGTQAVAAARMAPPDLILLDVMMPEMDGYETCAVLKAEAKLRDIPVIFLTARGEAADEEKGFSLGAVDYVVKPFAPSILLARVRTHVLLKQYKDQLEDRNIFLEAEVARRVQEVSVLQEVAINAMASLAETRDRETGAHIQRCSLYLQELAMQLRSMAEYADTLPLETIYLITKSAPLHDIGKMGIPDMILWKPSKLTSEEYALVKRHPGLGKQAIEAAEKLLETETSFLRFAKEMAYFHHERWDGRGYPEGLQDQL